MKNQFITVMAVAMFVTTLAVGSVRAQNAGTITVSIPFDFAIAGKTLPAGDYNVRRSIEGDRELTTIRNVDKTGALNLPQNHPVQTNEVSSESKLVFNKYGSQYFLSQVWFSGRTVGYELPKTARERLLQRKMASVQRKAESVAISRNSN